jgi:D-alanyl-D-alanine carboxypeptidase/D-alanyl-D-alanine-endopeptidase (penicillin-binding protein 4)
VRAPRRLLTCLLLACALVAAAAPVASALDRSALRSKLSRQMRLAGALAGAYVRDLDTGEEIYARKENVARPPASVTKLYTTATALLRFGPDATLRTRVLGAGALDDRGVWRGDLYLKGGGDPTLSRRQIAALASTFTAQTGIRRVAGSVLGDESLFDVQRGGARTGFAVDRDIGGVLSALAVSRGFSRDGAPAREAARRLARGLRGAGVRVDGATDAATAPAESVEIIGIDSPPVAQLAQLINVPSDNFAAEMLLKAMGARFGGDGSTAAGAAVVREQLVSFGIHPRIVDGSGLSRADRTTPRQVVRLLERMDGQPAAAAFAGSMAVIGRTGTVHRRMRGTAAQDRCRAKTGTLRAVSALAGVCTTTGGRRVAFAIMMSTRNIARAHRVQDRMTAAMATYGA